MGSLKKWLSGAPPPAPPEDLGAALMRLTRTYWARAPEELARLKPEAETLPWPKLLRLHHLACLELLHAVGLTTTGGGMDLPASPEAELYVQTATRLSSATSPFRPRQAVVTQRPRGEAPGKTITGELRNASATHFGALELIRLDKDNHPLALDFASFDELALVAVGPPSLFPPSKLQYRDGRTEVACLPLLYGASWFSAQASDANGSMTRFVGHTPKVQGGIGVGHQDFMCGGVLFGLGSMQQLAFS
jgi:hypothetical protein